MKRSVTLLTALVAGTLAAHAAKPLKVFILAGQSDMEGVHGRAA